MSYFEEYEDMELCFAMAQVALKEWMMKEYGGY